MGNPSSEIIRMRVTSHCAVGWMLASIFLGAILNAHPADDSSSEETNFFESDIAPNPWTDVNLLNDPDNFQFVIISDRTGGMRDGIFKEAIRKINLLQPEFVMSIGDLISGSYDNEEQINREWDDFNKIVNALEMKFFYVAGNHDTWSPYSNEIWETRFGPRYYHFIYHDVLFLILHSEDGSLTSIGDEQIQYVSKTLSENRDVRWTFVFIHKPLWAYEDSGRGTGWGKIDTLIRDRKHTVFAGHFHRYTKFERNNYQYYHFATTGGGSELRGPLHGQFDHIVWVTMTDAGPRLVNLTLDGIYDDDIRTEEMDELTYKLKQSFELDIHPVFGKMKDENESVETALHIKNSAEIPMQVNGYFKTHAILQPDPYAINTQLAPLSEKDIKLKFTFLNRFEDRDAILLPMNLNISFNPDGFPGNLIFEETVMAAIDTWLIIPVANNAVFVDGDLSEWDRLPFIMKNPSQMRGDLRSWTGPDDASLKFGLSQDKDFLYLACDVRDDSWISKPGKYDTTRSQDHLGIIIDSRPTTEREVKITSYNDIDKDTIILYIDPKPFEETISHQRSQLPESLYFTGVPTENGYTVEVAIPHSALNAHYGKEWESLRFNLAQFDIDKLTGSIVHLWWRPSWTTHRSYKNSGTFLRNPTDDD